MDNQYKIEIERIQKVYDRFEQEGRSKRVWAPFSEFESAYRGQQIVVFSSLMRKKGFVDLTGFRMLDVGCGLGRQLRMFLDMGAAPEDLYGIDISRNSISAAKLLSPNLQFSVSNGWDIEYPSDYFDLVSQFVVFSSIAKIDLQRRVAAEMYRVLKPGGYLYWWDMIYMAHDAGGETIKLDPQILFPGLKGSSKRTGMYPLPGETIRNLHGLRKFIGPILNQIAHRQNHLATLFGPKQTVTIVQK